MNGASRYLSNAKEILKKSPIDDNIYTDSKYVKSACGLAYLGVLKAIDEYLLKRGLTKKELPKKVEEYEKALKKYLSVHDGKLLREFESLYDLLHIAGYYRGLLYRTSVVKDALKDAETFIQHLENTLHFREVSGHTCSQGAWIYQKVCSHYVKNGVMVEEVNND